MFVIPLPAHRNVLFLALALAFASTSNAQQEERATTEADLEGQVIEEIFVTGTRIKRRDFTTPSPLTTVETEDIEFSGQLTIEETLNQMPQVLPDFGRTSNNPGNGMALVNLRGMGSGRTLVLLNGRRVAPSGTRNNVDLNNIPQFLVDRVEVITGGTSTVYGSDAIAGVVNFITMQDYSGFGIQAGASMAEAGDAESYDLSLAYGHNFANGRGNLTVFASWFERQPLLAADREFTRIPYWDTWEGEIVEGGSTRVPEGIIYFPGADIGGGSARVTFNADVSQRLEGYVEASQIVNEPKQNLAAVPAQLYAEINLDNPVLVPETQQLFADNYACDVNLACVILGKRFIELGERTLNYERDYRRLVAGIRGELWDGWDIDGWITYTTESSTDRWQNDASRSRLLQGLLVDPATNECFDPSGGCVPLNIFGEQNLSPEGIAFLRHEDYQILNERTHKLASLYLTGSPVDTWAGPLDVAFGADWRAVDTEFVPDEALSTGDMLGYDPIIPVSGADEVVELYAEAVVPLIRDRRGAENLALELGARYSDYKYSGGLWTYKAGGEWQPIEGLRFRAMHQRSVRAPNSEELFAEQGTATFWLFQADPCSASADPEGSGNAEKCVIQGLPADQVGVFEAIDRYPVVYTFGGNPDLVPETGETWTAGVVMTPSFMPNWTITVDYFTLEVTDTIGWIDAMEICFDPLNTVHEFCDDIARDVTGNVSDITELTSNRGILETTGVDTQVQYSTELPASLSLGSGIADLSVNVYWTHMFTNKEQENPVTEVIDCAGYFGWPCDFRANTFSADRVTTNVHYAAGQLGLHLTWRFIDGTDNAAPLKSEIVGYPDPDLSIPYISSENYLDFGASYDFTDNLSARFGVSNLLDNEPPFMADAVRSNNTDTGLFDIFGRSYYLVLSAHY
jgi:outer membrane receptor protein involved in Fe transport